MDDEAEKVMIHVRFAPNGSVVEIGERPQGINPQEWFDLLADKKGLSYQALAGGRGVYRLTREELDLLKGGIAA